MFIAFSHNIIEVVFILLEKAITFYEQNLLVYVRVYGFGKAIKSLFFRFCWSKVYRSLIFHIFYISLHKLLQQFFGRRQSKNENNYKVWSRLKS